VKTCTLPSCNKQFGKKPKQSTFDYEQQKFCCKKCRNEFYKANIQPVKLRDCPVCREEIKRLPGQNPSAYNKKGTCGKAECKREYVYGPESEPNLNPAPQAQIKKEAPKIPKRSSHHFDRHTLSWMHLYYPYPENRHETIVMEADPDSYSEKCSHCHERVANPFTGKCDVCILPRSRDVGRFRYL
jgi:hypothetical protein